MRSVWPRFTIEGTFSSIFSCSHRKKQDSKWWRTDFIILWVQIPSPSLTFPSSHSLLLRLLYCNTAHEIHPRVRKHCILPSGIWGKARSKTHLNVFSRKKFWIHFTTMDIITYSDDGRVGRVLNGVYVSVDLFVCFFTRYLDISKKTMHLGSPHFTQKCSTVSPGNPFILRSKGQRSMSRDTIKHCRRGCWLLSVTVVAILRILCCNRRAHFSACNRIYCSPCRLWFKCWSWEWIRWKKGNDNRLKWNNVNTSVNKRDSAIVRLKI